MGLIMKNGIQYPGVGSGEGSGLEISQLDDVKITPPLENGDKLVYDKEKGKWTNTTKYHNYSTEEQIVGTWIDGKPIYEISYYNETPNVSSTYNDFVSTGVILNNIDNIININGTVIRDIGDGKLCYPIAYESNDYKLIVRPYAIGNSDDYDIKYCAYFSSNSIKNLIITVQYTKTTD